MVFRHSKGQKFSPGKLLYFSIQITLERTVDWILMNTLLVMISMFCYSFVSFFGHLRTFRKICFKFQSDPLDRALFKVTRIGNLSDIYDLTVLNIYLG